jgi:tetraacyldisaccharide 4'-kinase
VIVSDDGLQHYRLARDVELVVFDHRLGGNGFLLPAGPLREPLSRLTGIDLRVCNGGSAQPGEVPMRLAGDVAVPVERTATTRPLAAFAGSRVHAVAAIGNPGRFFDGLRAHGIEVVEHAFADHHAFVADDLAFDDGLPVLMTEKDAVKCVRFATSLHWCVPVRAQLPEAFFDDIAGRLKAG